MEKERINMTINTTNDFFTRSEDCQLHMTKSLMEHPETHKAIQNEQITISFICSMGFHEKHSKLV